MSASRVLVAVAEHLGGFELNEPVQVTVRVCSVGPMAIVQLSGESVPAVAWELLAWADTLDNVTASAWCPASPDDDMVFLEVRGRLTDDTPVKVFAGLLDWPRLPLLAGGDRTALPWAVLRSWVLPVEEVAA